MSTAERRAGSTDRPGADQPGPVRRGSDAAGSGSPRGATTTAKARPVREPASAGPAVPASARRVLRPPRRRGATVRKVDPWSVLKLSVIFYLCVLLVGMLALTIFWAVVNRAGVLEALYTIAADTFNVQIRFDGGNIARALFLIGLLNVVLGSALNVFLSFLYNLIADLVGGLRVILELEE